LHPAGLEVVTVGMDTEGAAACRPYIEAARPEHPSLIDVGHRLAERFGVLNVPNGIWIDEQGTIVRPAEPAFPGVKPLPEVDLERIPRRMKDILAEAARIRADAEGYAEALRDWVAHGASSRWALPADEVVARSGRRDRFAAEAAAHFELAQHLHRAGRVDAAVRQFRQAHRLAPDNIAYKRQAWSLATPGSGPFERFLQGPLPGREGEWPYDSDWLTEIRALGPENYYPPMR
jgi:hypothetical protein